jgi:hypothetical protein
MAGQGIRPNPVGERGEAHEQRSMRALPSYLENNNTILNVTDFYRKDSKPTNLPN